MEFLVCVVLPNVAAVGGLDNMGARQRFVKRPAPG
jgi:hypothetical protein